MNRILRFASILSVLCLFGVTLPASADETGMGKPTTQTTSASLMTTSADCSLVSSFFGLCETAETVNIEDNTEE